MPVYIAIEGKNRVSLFEHLRHELGLLDFPADNVTLTGRDPVYPTPFRIGEAAAAILALQGVMLTRFAGNRGHLHNK